MSAPAAIAASLVNMRNVGSHKCVALTIHVPEEQAQSVIEAFGWPTMAAPVPVALARLNTETPAKPAGQDGEGACAELPGRTEPASSPSASKERKAWHELPPSQQAAIRCGEPAFRSFMFGTRRAAHIRSEITDTATYIAEQVRRRCGVESRRELDTKPDAATIWFAIDQEFQVATGRLAHVR